MRRGSGDGRKSRQAAEQDASPLPEYQADATDLESDEDMAEAIVAAHRAEFAALSDLNDGAKWGGAAQGPKPAS